MLKKGIKNFFGCLKYFFTPLGTMFLGIMLGVSIFIPSAASAINTLADNVTKLSQSVSLDIDLLWNNLRQAVVSLNWDDPINALQTLVSSDWINNVLTQTLTNILGTDFDTFKTHIEQIIDMFCNSLVGGASAFLACWLLGFLAGLSLTRFLIRRNIAKRSIWKFILAYFLNSLLATVYVAATLIVFSMWSYSIIFTVILALLLGGSIAMIQAYLLYAYKKLPFNQIVNVKNAGLLLLTNFIIFAVSAGFTLIVLAINTLMGLFVGLSLFAIATTVINLNAESYVLEQVQSLSDLPNGNNSEIVNDDASDDDTVADEIK